jgi:hypothetical protein
MQLFKKLPGYRREPHGLEWALMKKLPYALLVGTAVPALTALGMRVIQHEGNAAEIAKLIKTTDIVLIAAAVTAWTAVLTIAIGCFVVIVMKGPAYVADAYQLHDAEQPYQRGQKRSNVFKETENGSR